MVTELQVILGRSCLATLDVPALLLSLGRSLHKLHF